MCLLRCLSNELVAKEYYCTAMRRKKERRKKKNRRKYVL
jgi:hypothetical protein